MRTVLRYLNAPCPVQMSRFEALCLMVNCVVLGIVIAVKMHWGCP